MGLETLVLTGKHVRLEPLGHHHADALAAASAADPSLYTWSLVPQGDAQIMRYIDAAIAGRAEGTAAPFAIVRLEDESVAGSTRFWNLERWAWPEGHPRRGRLDPDNCEIGHTWLTRSAIRTAANTESKLLLLTHAFETWQVLGVSLYTDARNARSRAAIERLGAKFDGILRAHRLAADLTPRNSVRYSILSGEWPAIKARLSS